MSEYDAYLARTPSNFHTAEFSLNVGPIVRTILPHELQYREKDIKYVKHYKLGDVIGEGNFGKVREAIDTRTMNRVAIKTLNLKRLRKMRSGEANVRREIGIMKMLNHVNVAQFIELIEIEEKQKMYIVMELVGGGSLRTLLESMPDGRLPSCYCRWYFHQLIDGVDYLHNEGIVHRDIKPSNLMITTTGILKIADFGVAEILSDSHVDAALVSSDTNGTPSFLSPEVASGEKAVSGRNTDLWAVGVTLYVLVTGKVPFVGLTLYQLLQNISKGEFEIPHFVEPDLADLLKGLLQPSVANRLSIEEIRVHPWLCNAELLRPPPPVRQSELSAPAAETDVTEPPSTTAQNKLASIDSVDESSTPVANTALSLQQTYDRWSSWYCRIV